MKTIISIFTVLLIILLNSCRPQDDLITETFTGENMETAAILSREKTDSIQISSVTTAVNETPKTDPPPKSGQQWKH